MSADTLREAARVMREKAEGAIQSPWTLGSDKRVAVEVEGYGLAGICEPFRAGDAAHIASWHPAVALAVADWLDHEAARCESNEEHGGKPTAVWSRAADALAVARAYLGEDS